MTNEFYRISSIFIERIAQVFGYPENPGMPVYNPAEPLTRLLPLHKNPVPIGLTAKTVTEVFLSAVPKVSKITKYRYQNEEEGFYNFYIQNYRNLHFLPDWLSEFLQVRLNICFDTRHLELIRQYCFLFLLIYMQLSAARLILAWFLTVNPFYFPISLLLSAVDWSDELLHGSIPAIYGVNITGGIVIAAIGQLADGLNHLVFTMPFLPSEAEEAKRLINDQMQDVLVFHYLPVLWYKHPIPNNIREFWYEEKPDILNYMQAAYKDLEIQFLPDSIIKQLNLNQQSDLVSQSSAIHDYLEYLSTETLFQSNDFVNYINLIHDNFHNFVLNHINSLL